MVSKSAHRHEGQEKVLVIDNDPLSREWLSRKLSREGLQVISAEGGREGIELARRERPLAIFLDVLMPDLDGWAVLAALQADPDLAGIPVVMVTMVDERNRGRDQGVLDYLLKPVDGSRLSRLVAQLRRRQQPGRALIVEDDPLNREMLARLLTRQGWQVETAENGRDALAAVAHTPPDVILLDLMLPVMDGRRFVEELRRVPAYLSIPIVVLTAKDLTEEDRQVLGQSVRKVLQKGSCHRDDILREILC